MERNWLFRSHSFILFLLLTAYEIEGNNKSYEKIIHRGDGTSPRVSCAPIPTHVNMKHGDIKAVISQHLDDIHRISTGSGGICTSDNDQFWGLPGIPISVHDFQLPKEKADLIAFFLPHMAKRSAVDQLQQTLNSLGDEPYVEGLHFIQFPEPSKVGILYYEKTFSGHLSRFEYSDDSTLSKFPWYFNVPHTFANPSTLNRDRFDTIYNIEPKAKTNGNLNILSYWTWPYFECRRRGNEVKQYKHLQASNPTVNRQTYSAGNWLISYSIAFRGDNGFYGLISFEVDLTHFPIDQCELQNDASEELKRHPMSAFFGTNKCDPETTTCKFLDTSPRGWFKGNYVCVCKPSHHALEKQWNNTIPGTYLESKWCKATGGKKRSATVISAAMSSSLHAMSSCHRCPDRCPDCIDKESCLAESNYGFRLSLLCISIIFSIGSLFLIGGVYYFRKSPIFSISSPIFLCITLFGCFIMYTEMAVLFPILSQEACIAVKWTRHLGFCITYTALYMKLCRVYLTFRVKSAHKIKLTEKHLLHWMSPIMVIMLLYLFAWTISDPPNLEMMKTHEGKLLYQCVYNWWDHVLSVGEVIFLAYGIFICWRIRENHDAQFISYSIYNIALVNVTMVSMHLLIIPNAGPDMKYLLAFLRTQLSTTVTIGLVLGSKVSVTLGVREMNQYLLLNMLELFVSVKSRLLPVGISYALSGIWCICILSFIKVYRAYRGEYPTLKQIANSANGFGGDALDVGEENLQLKEELQKMAMQMERLKSYAMCKNNRHLKTNIAAELDHGNFTTL